MSSSRSSSLRRKTCSRSLRLTMPDILPRSSTTMRRRTLRSCVRRAASTSRLSDRTVIGGDVITSEATNPSAFALSLRRRRRCRRSGADVSSPRRSLKSRSDSDTTPTGIPLWSTIGTALIRFSSMRRTKCLNGVSGLATWTRVVITSATVRCRGKVIIRVSVLQRGFSRLKPSRRRGPRVGSKGLRRTGRVG